MLIQKAYKYRLYPTDQQAQRLRQLCGCARFVWNYALNETLSIHDAGGKIPSAFDLNKRLTGWKKLPELAFLSEGYTDNLQQKLKDLRSAWDRCFDKSLTAEKARFQKENQRLRLYPVRQFQQILWAGLWPCETPVRTGLG